MIGRDKNGWRNANDRFRAAKSGVLIAGCSMATWAVLGCGQPSDKVFGSEGQSAASEPSALTAEELEMMRSGDQQAANAPTGSDEVLGLITTPPKRTHTIAGLLLNIGGGNPDLAKMTDLLTGPGQSLRHMYNEISFGIQDIQVDFIGPNTLPQPTCLPAVCCGPKTTQPNGPEVAAIIAGLPKKYDHYFWIYGTPLPPGANCGTWGDEGSANTPAVYSSYSFQSIVGMSQELGHNFGMNFMPMLRTSPPYPVSGRHRRICCSRARPASNPALAARSATRRHRHHS